MIFELPWAPSLNHYYRHVGSKVLISAKGRAYREAVAVSIIAQKVKAAPPGRLAVWLDIYPPNRQRRDLDNLPKCLLDALTHAGVYADDSLIDELHITRCEVVKGGKVVVHIKSIADRE